LLQSAVECGGEGPLRHLDAADHLRPALAFVFFSSTLRL